MQNGDIRMKNVYTVRQVNSYIKNMFAQDFMLNRIYVKGEVSNLKYHTSGHIYFSLKDESGTIACVMFAGSRSGLSFRMEEGQQIIVLGAVDVYARDGKYQLYARKIVRDGVGLLYERFELLKKELQEMGMFAPEYKQKIPKYIRRLGVVTAPTGAAVRDIINITKRRNPFVQIILYPALVQGEGASESIVKGIHALEAEKVDVMIVGRGGGSMEDLWAFNEEAVARAVFDCSVPVISAVGHETDTTIIDFVADLRAPTPSAAAELAVYDFMEMKKNLKLREERLLHFMQLILERKRQKLEQYSLRMRAYHPQQRLNEQRQFAADAENRLRREMMRRLEQEKYRLGLMAERLKGLSPLEKLSQGYAYVENSSGANVRTVSNVKQGEQITVYVTDGRIRAEVTGVEKEET
ncbi:exodeoxyribonuclease VII, large subunit [[Ruminococcus] lactaris ATCC 29176]|uniref:Exodeoxyribonuclease 7 large subunit n=2 Tax=[Ruminococcus] lactaris TaxID=46228 RepID=B5CM37_9FIRM|nr:exodeoxyribonuclease VII, large subunit [[Ruminococcus] lactaris ATCC 29176]